MSGYVGGGGCGSSHRGPAGARAGFSAPSVARPPHDPNQCPLAGRRLEPEEDGRAAPRPPQGEDGGLERERRASGASASQLGGPPSGARGGRPRSGSSPAGRRRRAETRATRERSERQKLRAPASTEAPSRREGASGTSGWGCSPEGLLRRSGSVALAMLGNLPLQQSANLRLPVMTVAAQRPDCAELARLRPPGHGLRVDSEHRRDLCRCE